MILVVKPSRLGPHRTRTLKTLIVEDPVPNFIVPVWVFVAYLLAAKKV
jgi:hypothetical protein